MSEEYDDDTPMPFGEHRGKKLSAVPAGYLHWWWTKTERSNKRLEAYIEKNLVALKQEYPDGIWT